jgi:Protein of unknown function (DUF3467)
VSNPASESLAPTAEQQEGQPAAQQQRAPRIEVDDTKAVSSYSNFCRVTGTPEELIIDFALNPQPMGVPTQPINITQRIVTNYYTAKRMLHALQLTIHRHEQAFGVLEIDINKRVVGGRNQ